MNKNGKTTIMVQQNNVHNVAMFFHLIRRLKKFCTGAKTIAKATAQKIAPKKGINRAKKSKLTKIRKTKNERNSKTRCIMISVRPRFMECFTKYFLQGKLFLQLKKYLLR